MNKKIFIIFLCLAGIQTNHGMSLKHGMNLKLRPEKWSLSKYFKTNMENIWKSKRAPKKTQEVDIKIIKKIPFFLWKNHIEHAMLAYSMILKKDKVKDFFPKTLIHPIDEDFTPMLKQVQTNLLVKRYENCLIEKINKYALNLYFLSKDFSSLKELWNMNPFSDFPNKSFHIHVFDIYGYEKKVWITIPENIYQITREVGL